MDNKLRVASLFAGIGGFDLALERLGHQIVYVNEWDKHAAGIYELRLGHPVDQRDIAKVPSTDIPDHDLLVGGFPCQAFSVAGKRRGFDDTRGTLFFEVARILRDKRSRYFILENVKGLLSHDSGKTFSTILGVLTDLGYEFEWQVLNSKDFGVPQNRERVLIVGHLRGEPSRKIFPLRDTNPTSLKYVGGILSEANKKWLDNGKELSRNFSQGQRVYEATGLASTLASQAGGLGGKTGLYAIPVLTPDRAEKRQNGRRFKTNGEPMFTLTAQDKHGVVVQDGQLRRKEPATTVDANYWKGLDNHQQRTGVKQGLRIRKLTPTECERLQGFPDGWTVGVSDSQRYKQLGNAVTVNVVYEVAKRAFA